MVAQKKASKKLPKAATPTALAVVRPQVAGIDIGSAEHWVCGPARADGALNVRGFGTTTDALHALADWLVAQHVESVAMESTSVYWIPLYELLESRGVEVVLVNARQLHHVPGRKTDVSDCQWLQLLHSCGLLRGSFRPTEAIVRLRALQRQVANLVAERTRCVQWMHKALDQMNVQVHRAVADLTGTTGMAIVRAIVAGERDPTTLAAHRDRRCRKHGHLRLEEGVRTRVLSASAATIDRLLAEPRAAARGRLPRRASARPSVRRSVAVRTFADWKDPAPAAWRRTSSRTAAVP